MAKNDGGPAFPATVSEEGKEGWPEHDGKGAFVSDAYEAPGMTLRDFFAAKAMALCDFEYEYSKHWTHEQEAKINAGNRAREAIRAYAIADAMLAARGKP